MASFAKRACPLAGYALRQVPRGRAGKAHKRACFEKSGFLADSAILLVLYTNFAQIRLLLTHILIKIYKYRCTKGIRRRWGCPQARWLRSRARQASACSRPAALPAHPWARPAVLRSFRPPGGADGAEDDAACLTAGKEDDKASGAAWRVRKPP